MLLRVVLWMLVGLEKMRFCELPESSCTASGGFLLLVLLKMLESIDYLRQLAKIGVWEAAS